MNIKKKLLNHWPIFTYLGIVLFLFSTNYNLGTYLTGWDNLHPEFYFTMNIKRSLFAVWQEYQSLGLLGGMGHSTDLIHQLVLFLLSLIIPLSFLRYFWTFLMLFTGSVGMYMFAQFLFKRFFLSYEQEGLLAPKSFAFLVGLFYLLNLSTIQTFYAPFEAFIAHFAALPWLLFASLQYIYTSSKKNLIFLSLVLLLATPAAYIPTLFVVYIIAITLLAGITFLQDKTKTTLFNIVKMYTAILFINAFWLFPFIYFTLTSSQVNLNSKINQMATDTIFAQNKEFGTISSVTQLKGFWFNNIDPNLKADYTYMMPAWRAWNLNPIIDVLGYVLFAIVLVGIYYALRHSKRRFLPFIILFVFAFGVLAIDTFPFSFINELVRNNIRILHQAFRFPFTKFSNLTALTYAIFFGLGVLQIIQWLKKIPAKSDIFFKKNSVIVFGASVLVVIFVLPAFVGNFFYARETIKLPNEYIKLFDYFKHQPKDGRIANFPQQTLWGWQYYSWGYGGSGFLWYGIEQPILDRAFDVWSRSSENYYTEVSQALYAKNSQALNDVFNKYQIKYLLVDKSIINPFAPKALFYTELEEAISKLSNIKRSASFGKIDVYTVTLSIPQKNFVSGTSRLPSTNDYEWGYDDQAFNTLARYNTSDTTPQVYYPFRSLFSLKSEKEESTAIHEDKDFLYFEGTIPSTYSSLTIPSFSRNTALPVVIQSRYDIDRNLILEMHILTPEITVGNTKVFGQNITDNPLFIIPPGTQFPLKFNVNGVSSFTVENKEGIVGLTFLAPKQDNIFTLSDEKQDISQSRTIPVTALEGLSIFEPKDVTIPQSSTITVKVPKINDGYLGMEYPLTSLDKIQNCDGFRNGSVSETRSNTSLIMTSRNATACTSGYLPNLPHNMGYVIALQGKHIQGRNLHFWFLNEDEKIAHLDTYILTQKPTFKEYLIAPPMEDFGRAYSLHFDNISFGNDVTTNELNRIAVFPIPYEFISHLTVNTSDKLSKASAQGRFDVSHPNESLYIVHSIKQAPSVLTLSQSYDPLWKAYVIPSSSSPIVSWFRYIFPFFTGTEIKSHIKVNNWENGWELPKTLPSQSQIVIVYLPQYLEYIGFVLLLLYMDSVLNPLKRINNKLKKSIHNSWKKTYTHAHENPTSI